MNILEFSNEVLLGVVTQLHGNTIGLYCFSVLVFVSYSRLSCSCQFFYEFCSDKRIWKLKCKEKSDYCRFSLTNDDYKLYYFQFLNSASSTKEIGHEFQIDYRVLIWESV
jgi:hypothetical protein